MKKKYRIHPITKFYHSAFCSDREDRFIREHDDGFINLSAHFWSSIFDRDNLLSQFTLAQKKIPDPKSHLISQDNFLYYINAIDEIRALIGSFEGRVPEVDEIILGYRILTQLLESYKVTEPDWTIDLAQGVTYVQNNFSSDNPDISHIDAIVAEGDMHFPYRYIQSILDPLDIHNSIIIIDFFWPGELLQILMICSILKKNGNTIIIDATNGNEQFDFTQWISVFTEKQHLFDYFDYFLVYQDYGRSLNSLLEELEKEPVEQHILPIPNSISRDDLGIVSFIPPTRNPDTDILYDQFTSFYLDAKHIFTVAGDRAITLRLLPYKCYWSACNFCAINSTNLYAFHKDKESEIRRYVDACIAFLGEHFITQVIFMDEAIHPDVIEYFADRIIGEGIEILYMFRTRFELAFTPELCSKLFDSGARYCGIGLETAIDRLEATINKGLGAIPVQKKQEIIHSFDASGISLHNYAIFGFPGETPEESIANARFLMNNIQSLSHYTCTPNTLSLMRGTTYFTQAKRFGIEVSYQGVSELSLNYNFQVAGVPRNFLLYQKLASKIHRAQFLPWFRDGQMDAFHFWTFIDRSTLFYLLKRKCQKNPYREYWNRNIPLLSKKSIDIGNEYLSVALGNQWIVDTKDPSRIAVYNWVSDRSLKVPQELKIFLEKFSNEITLQENLDRHDSTFDTQIINEWIVLLLESRILILKNK